MKNGKVLIVCDKNPCTSFGRLSLDICKALLKKNFNADILWLVTPKYFKDGAPLKGKSIYAHSLYTGYISFRKPFRNVLQNIQPDIVFFIRPELGFLLPEVKNTLQSAKTVVMVHDTFAETLYKKSLKFMLINAAFIAHAKNADFFVYNSNYTKTESEKHFGVPTCGGIVIGCAIDYSIFQKKELDINSRREFLKAHGLPENKPLCLNVSLDEPRKNLDTFFKTAALRPEVSFVRIGRLRKATAKRLSLMRLSNVYHFENVNEDELVAFYHYANLFMYPSYLEGFGLPPLEALACGTSVVASATSALKENLALTVPLIDPPDNALAYAQVLDQVLAGTSIVNEEYKQELLQKFSLDSFADKLFNALKSL